MMRIRHTNRAGTEQKVRIPCTIKRDLNEVCAQGIDAIPEPANPRAALMV